MEEKVFEDYIKKKVISFLKMSQRSYYQAQNINTN